jgi:hypothetical protein
LLPAGAGGKVGISPAAQQVHRTQPRLLLLRAVLKKKQAGEEVVSSTHRCESPSPTYRNSKQQPRKAIPNISPTYSCSLGKTALTPSSSTAGAATRTKGPLLSIPSYPFLAMLYIYSDQ